MTDMYRNPKRQNKPNYEDQVPEHRRLGITPRPIDNKYASQAGMFKGTGTMRGAGVPPIVVNLEERRVSPAIPVNMIDNNGFNDFDDLSDAVDSGDTIDFDEPEETTRDLEGSGPAVGDYILMVGSEILITGNLRLVEERAREILFDEDPDYKGTEEEDIVVLKRVDLRVGVHIEG